MQLSTLAHSLMHIIRPFVNTPIGIAGINTASEIASTGYGMPTTRAIFDNADLSGERMTYIGLVEAFSNLGAAVGAGVLVFLAFFLGEARSLEYFFFIAAAVVLLILTARFPLYRK